VQLYPALDLSGGGLARAATAPDPVTLAHQWRVAGATWLHVVDLDRVWGTGNNTSLVRRLVTDLDPPVQLGGAPATVAAVEEMVAWGAARVVAGVAAIEALPALVARHGAARIALSLDVRDGAATTLDGVVAGNPMDLLALARHAGVETIVYRDLGRDGTLTGAALTSAKGLVGHGVGVVLAGGIAGLDELRVARDAGFAGVVVGRALLDGTFSIEDALTCCG
jgi:phosphoribosylformimino-5-aminoimidazole carboxamide ribonucleotide (ProFAR) isomerase